MKPIDQDFSELPTLYTAEEVGTYLHCDQTTVEKKALAGELRGTKIGKGWVFLAEDVARFIRDEIDAHSKRKSSRCSTPAAQRKKGPPSLVI